MGKTTNAEIKNAGIGQNKNTIGAKEPARPWLIECSDSGTGNEYAMLLDRHYQAHCREQYMDRRIKRTLEQLPI
jgi:hypothetical protein